jgi:hypothetical protein
MLARITARDLVGRLFSIWGSRMSEEDSPQKNEAMVLSTIAFKELNSASDYACQSRD